MKKIILIGYGGHAKSIIDSIRQTEEYEIIGYIDKHSISSEIRYPYLGKDDILPNIFKSGIYNAVISVGYLGTSNVRDRLYNLVKDIGFCLPVIFDRTAILAENISIGEGTYIGKGVIINTESEIGRMCIINSGAVVEHENKVGDFSHVSVKTVLCGNVTVGDHVFIGANSTIIQGINIRAYSNIGAGSIVLNSVSENMKIHGVWNGK